MRTPTPARPRQLKPDSRSGPGSQRRSGSRGGPLSRGWIGVWAARWDVARLLPHAGWPLAAGLTLLNLTLGGLPVVFVIATSAMIGMVPSAVRGGLDSAAWGSLIAVFAVAAASFVAQEVISPFQKALGELMARRIDGEVFQQVMARSTGPRGVALLEDQQALGDLRLAARDLEPGLYSPGQACAGILALVARYTQLIGFAAVVGVAFSWLAAAGLLGAVVLFRNGRRRGFRRFLRIWLSLEAADRKLNYFRNLGIEAPAGKEIRVFGLAHWLRDRLYDVHLKVLRPLWAERRKIYLWPFFWYATTGLTVAAAVFGLIGASASGALTLTDFALVMQAALGALRLSDHYPEIDTPTAVGVNAHDAVMRFTARADAEPSGVSGASAEPSAAPSPAAIGPPDAAPEIQVKHEIHIKDLSFRYPGAERAVFDGLQLRIPAGTCTAIVGLNGAGKTTLVKLLARLYEPSAGAVIVDGADIRSYPVEIWRRKLGVIFQDFARHEVSLADNIGFGAIDAVGDRAGIRAVADAVGLGPAIARLPQGIDTVLAKHLSGGAELSGGQWQRVALARALFAYRHGAPIVVLDEPTASLDVRAEARFFGEFTSLARGATTLLISHRFSTVRHADLIVVMADGRVVEQGSHQQLLVQNGRYAELFQLQAGRFTDLPREEVTA